MWITFQAFPFFGVKGIFTLACWAAAAAAAATTAATTTTTTALALQRQSYVVSHWTLFYVFMNRDVILSVEDDSCTFHFTSTQNVPLIVRPPHSK